MKKFLIVVVLMFGFIQNIWTQNNNVSNKRLKEAQKEVDEINMKIKQYGLSWKAGITSISLLSKEERKKLCGIPYHEKKYNNETDRTKRALKKNMQTQGIIVSLIDWMSPISYQTCGNCFVHAATGVVEAELHRYLGQNYSIDLDEKYVTNHIEDGCNGGYISNAFYEIRKHKACSELGLNSFPNYDHAFWTITENPWTDIPLEDLLDAGKPVAAGMDTVYNSGSSRESVHKIWHFKVTHTMEHQC